MMNDENNARLSAVMLAIDRVTIPNPEVETVEIRGDRAIVRFAGSDGSRVQIQLQREGGYWQPIEDELEPGEWRQAA